MGSVAFEFGKVTDLTALYHRITKKELPIFFIIVWKWLLDPPNLELILELILFICLWSKIKGGFIYQIVVRLQNRLISAGLEPVILL